MTVVLSAEGLATELSDKERKFRFRADHFEMERGEVVSLSGPSGSGKTLFLELLALLRRPLEGGHYTAHVQGTALALGALWQTPKERASIPEVRSLLFGIVPQTGALLPFLTARENISLSQTLADRVDPDYVEHLISHLGLKGVAHQNPSELSIGQRQRTAVARALAHKPAIIIADEPTAALDPEAADTVLDLFLALARESGSTVLLSSHDLPRVHALGLKRHMRIVAQSNPDEPGLVESRVHIETAVAA